MRYRVLVARRGRVDITAIAVWLQERSPVAADKWLDAVEAALASLARRPQRCHLAPEAAHLGRSVRQFIVGKYRLLFVVEGNAVVVLHVRHGARKEWNGADQGP